MKSLQPGHSRRGQSLIEGTLVLLLFCAFLFAVVDCGMVLVAHQSMVERVRAAVRWGVVRPFDGNGNQIANLILYNQPDEPRAATEAYLGLTRLNVVVHYQHVLTRPDDEILSVAIVDYQYHFLSPWLPTPPISSRPVSISAPMAYRVTASR
jgi:TadE-like protein